MKSKIPVMFLALAMWPSALAADATAPAPSQTSASTPTANTTPVATAAPAATVLMAPPSAGLPAYPAVVRQESPAEHDARLKWFREARFGLFIHWGVYSALGGSWQGRPVTAEWIMNRAKISVADYKAQAKNFTADKYDPQAWAQLAKDAGMKYIVITAKHHEGFTLYDSAYSDWNAVKASGAGRDLLQPLADAARAQGLKFGLYYSQSQDWVNPGGSKGAVPPWDPAQAGDFDTYLAKVSLPQVREILEKYHPDYLWWDTEYQMTPERARPFFELVSTHPNLITNSRLGGGVLGDVRTSEQKANIPTSSLGRPMEVCMTINDSWAYNTSDTNWKSVRQLIQTLSHVASRGGNFLLDIGPTAEGVIPQPEVDRLLAMGRWLKINGEAIYATQGGPYANTLPWGRTTQKARTDGGATLYLHVWDWPADGKLLVPGITQMPISGRLLAGGAAVSSAMTNAGLVVQLPEKAPDPDVSVVALEFAGPIKIAEEAAAPATPGAPGWTESPVQAPGGNGTAKTTGTAAP
jgi:alpha-L-fucosidase